jgi:predicted dehydrogenase/threonine dehydrogenase-like Zn-dependent dehydrogenase
MLVEVPAPQPGDGSLLIRTRQSLVSIGTERMLINFGRSGWIEKARQQPAKVKAVLHKIRTDGLFPTLEAIRAKLDQPIPLGYASVGEVIELAGPTSNDRIGVGDRVVSNGPHAEIVSVPKNLCAKVPEEVSDEEAAFTVVAAIGLQGIRLLEPTLGESFVVTGLGLIGLLSVQILRAHGCRVLGIDFDSAKCALARRFGAESVDLSKGEDALSAAIAFSQENGVDGVLITASTESNEPVHQAAMMCRKRGRIVLIGVTGLQLARADFYEKELSFQVSCSYGPGRYDESYERRGNDYPIGYVRWTEQRNFAAVLDLIAARKLDLQPLITHRFSFEDALKAYGAVSDPTALGIMLKYEQVSDLAQETLRKVELREPAIERPGLASDRPVVGLIGAGSFTGQTLLPALKETGARLKTIASAAGVTGTHLGKKFGFEISTTDATSVLTDPEIDAVLITTRHDSHARYVQEALKAGKRVYVEKPLCLNRAELDTITDAYHSAPNPFLMVGFNRRFAPQVTKMKELLVGTRECLTMIMTVNAGATPAEHWTQDPTIGGGRIIGEGCHYIDLLRYLTGSAITSIEAAEIGGGAGVGSADNVTFTLKFADGSIGTVHYFANGHKSFPKERLEVFCAGRILQLDNFRKLTGFGWPNFKSMNLWRQDKGHRAEMKALIDALKTHGPSPIPMEEIVEVTLTSFRIAECTHTNGGASPLPAELNPA